MSTQGRFVLVRWMAGSGAARTAAVAGRAHGSPPTFGHSPRPRVGRWDNIRFWDICKGAGAVGPVEKSIYSAEYQRLCALLRELRQEAGLTQVQVAAELGVPQSFVSKY